MKIKKILQTVALGALTVLGSTAAMAQDKVRIATEGAYAPFNAINEQGELIGFDVEIARALCAEMKVECEIVAQDWDGIIPGLMGRKYDAIIASMSVTKERQRVVDFTDRYYSNVLAFVGAKGKELDTSEAGLKGLTVGAQRATRAGQYLEDHLADVVNVKLYGTQSEAYLDMANGRLDAMLSDKFPAYDWLRSADGENFEFKGADIDINDEIAIAVRKRDPLKEKFNAAIKAIVENGTYAEINARYFPFSIY
ncbi:ABC transporter substrate-binding protein [Marinobacterium sediminicola]|uniref:Polar amino acid transport system substrate-binding protein n=1 Tax=Marinobacterium sediminicola TaxID=518898 RepID=A0ABY1S184_9GAMM|nr:ABC transporter substrate-binding protein [Marinobacterium sediminicola]ULG68318.1 ABC transporter substrate-binding protein [Marinobacterium sediminicola]SMR74813.1 polar amino acid transport system substrate-binding protein [Marinobacterium sediminicola]